MWEKLLDFLLGNSQWMIKHTSSRYWEGVREGRYDERVYMLNDLDSLNPEELSAADAVETLREFVQDRGGSKAQDFKTGRFL